MSGSKTGGKAHKFKGCKSGKCAEFYYMATGPLSGKWFSGNSKTGIYMSSSLFSSEFFLLVLAIRSVKSFIGELVKI